MDMLNHWTKVTTLGFAAIMMAGVAGIPSQAFADKDILVLHDDLSEPIPGRSRAAGEKAHQEAQARNGEYGAIGGSVEERFARFQAEKKGRVKHFQDVVNRNHMKKYGEKVR